MHTISKPIELESSICSGSVDNLKSLYAFKTNLRLCICMGFFPHRYTVTQTHLHKPNCTQAHAQTHTCKRRFAHTRTYGSHPIAHVHSHVVPLAAIGFLTHKRHSSMTHLGFESRRADSLCQLTGAASISQGRG